MGLAVSIRADSLTFLALKDFGALLAMRILQIALVAAYFLPLSLLGWWLNSIHRPLAEYDNFLIPAVAVFAIGVYLFYRKGRAWMLRRAVRLASAL